VATHTPLLGAELLIEAGASLTLDVDPSFEHGVLVDSGVLSVADQETKPSELAYVPVGRERIELVAEAGPARVRGLGGPPFGESIVMWWNFVGRSHEEIVAFRDEWQGQIDGELLRDGRFGIPVDDASPPIPAPPLPNARLKERR
jgi:redox-sensitive bicupin YhaK (pirin superfamily)